MFKRIIQFTKWCLYKMLGQAKLSYDEILTVTEVEMIVNSRTTSEYLLELREAHHFGKKTNGTTPITVSDIVAVHDDTKHQGFWNLGKIEETLPG